MAWKQKPYGVVPLKYFEILDLKSFLSNKNFKRDATGGKVKWRQLKWLQFRKSKPEHVYANYDFQNNSEFVAIATHKPLRGRKSSDASPSYNYTSKLPISAAKKNDLVNMCNSGIIPSEFHSYYNDMKSSKSVKDAEPESDIDGLI